MNVYHNRIHIKTIKLMLGQNPPQDKIPPKIQNLIYKSVYQNVYVEYGRVVVGIKSPQDKKMQKIQNLIYMMYFE